MEILKINVLKGPNYWSIKRKNMILMKLDLGEYEFFPSNKLPGFNQNLKELIPSLYNHRCSEGVPGGFFVRLDDGTWLGHVIEHIALELQTLAGMECGFGRTYRTNQEGVYHVMFVYEHEKAGLYAAKVAVDIVECLAVGKSWSHLEENLDTLKAIHAREKFGPSTQSILDEAKSRNIPFHRVKNTSLVHLGQGCRQKKIWATVTSETSLTGMDIANNKELTKQVLKTNFIPVPDGVVVMDKNQLHQAIDAIGYPLVIKPDNGNHGRGITTNVNTRAKAEAAFVIASKISGNVIVERYVEGEDYRFLVINNRMVAAARRIRACITGDGKHSIQELIDIVNADPKRGKGHESVLTAIQIDECTLNILSEKGLTSASVLPENEILYVKDSANLSTGGTAIDITDEVHPHNIHMVERAAKLIGLDICGIDMIAKDIQMPVTGDNGAIIEANAGPGFRMHLSPTEGKGRNVAASVLDMLYPEGEKARIPVVAVTGTNGKTSVVRLIAHMAQDAGHHVGFTTTEGIYENQQLLFEGDCSGPESATAILQNPSVEYAVLECARGGILRSGLGFDQCDISIITNISNDHLGLNDIHTLEELADVKGVVAKSTAKEGYAILNADDELVYELKDGLECNIALFAHYKSIRIQEHCEAGGLAAYTEQDYIIIQQGPDIHQVAHIEQIPITFHGMAGCMVKNILPAALAGFISKFSISKMEQALYRFHPDVENNPGRMNVFSFENHTVMLDYAHNEGAYQEIKNYLDHVKLKKIGIIAAVGDRKADDARKIGYYAAQTFDEVIIRHNHDHRGRSNEELTQWIMEGVEEVKSDMKVSVISDELDAITHAMENITEETFIYYSVDEVNTAINFLKMKQAERKPFHAGLP